jgi:hypothetical protein
MNNKGLIALIAVVSVVSFGVSIVSLWTDNHKAAPTALPDTMTHTTPDITGSLEGDQAVFLTNGQVYFGKVVEYNSDYLRMNDVYYLKDSTSAATATDLTLVKLGTEPFGPEDPMFIKQQQILFLENLDPDGQVATNIKALESTVTPTSR